MVLGEYSPGGLSDCIRCPDGKDTKEKGATSESDCIGIKMFVYKLLTSVVIYKKLGAF